MKCHETNEFEQNFDTRSNTFISCVLGIAILRIYNKKKKILLQTSSHMVFKTIGGFFLSINRLFKTFKTMTIDKFTVLKCFFFNFT